MKCPICNSSIDNNRKCKNCGIEFYKDELKLTKDSLEIILKKIELEQSNRNYKKALSLISEARLLTDDEEILENLERLESGIEFININQEESTNNNNLDKKTRNYNEFFIVLIFILVSVSFLVGYLFRMSREGEYFYGEYTKNIKLPKPEKIDLVLTDVVNYLVDELNTKSEKTGKLSKKDYNSDGIEEIVIYKDFNFYIFSNEGMLIYWYNAKNNCRYSYNSFKKIRFIFSDNFKWQYCENEKFANSIEFTEKSKNSEFVCKKIVTFNEEGIEVEYLLNENSNLNFYAILSPNIFDFNKKDAKLEENENKITVTFKNFFISLLYEGNKKIKFEKDGLYAELKLTKTNNKVKFLSGKN